MSVGYEIDTEGVVALVAATAKTVLAVVAAANAPVRMVEASVSFDGVDATKVPVLVEFVQITMATAGTSSAATVKQIRGATRTTQATGARAFTAEPTVVTALKPRLLTPNGGLIIVQFPLGREPESVISASTEAIGLRLTAPFAVNVRADIEFEEG